MSYKPSEFQIGVSELISILLPGAVATYICGPYLGEAAGTLGAPPLSGSGAWVAIAVLAYLLGHLIFLIGALLDWPYDRLRSRGRPRERDTTYVLATQVKQDLLGSLDLATNTYKFATALLGLSHADAGAEVRQLEADSKFFRSLAVLAALLLLAAGSHKQWVEVGLGGRVVSSVPVALCRAAMEGVPSGLRISRCYPGAAGFGGTKAVQLGA